MVYHIHSASSHIAEKLRQHPAGTVHSVYRRTVNLSFGDFLAAIQSDGSPLSPVSLITELTDRELSSLCVAPGDPVSIENDTIRIAGGAGDCVFSYSGAAVHELGLSPAPDKASLPVLAERIAAVLSCSGTGGFDLLFDGNTGTEELPLPLLAADRHIRRSLSLYRDARYLDAARELSGLIGLGSGLTPSGDDFLCGVLAGLTLAGETDAPFCGCLREDIRSRLRDTVDISAAFLDCALSGQYSLAVNNLLPLPSAGDIRESFLAIGHSSGMDTLCGILYALRLKE